jgi:hypothetical protein
VSGSLDAIADILIEEGYRYFSKTAHMRMGEYRQHSPLWRATATNSVDRQIGLSHERRSQERTMAPHGPWMLDRICYSHEYIGPDRKSYDPVWIKKEEYKQNDLFGAHT